MNNIYSNKLQTLHDVPQCTVLGLILLYYNLYIYILFYLFILFYSNSQLKLYINSKIIINYADETAILLSDNNTDLLSYNFNIIINNV